MNLERVWKPIEISKAGYLTQISRCFESFEEQNPGCFPNLRDGTDIIIASDYSGEDKGGAFYAYSFVFVDWDASEHWCIMSSGVRNEFLALNDREMRYTRLGDYRKKAALIPFLEAADHIKGVAITFLVSKRANSVLEAGGLDYFQQLVPSLANWEDLAIEKLYRVETLIAFLLAGLSRSEQPIHWITDEDEIVGNSDRLAIATNLLPRLSKTHFNHDMHLKDADTVKSLETQHATGFAKDLASIPDLIGGAMVHAWTATAKDGFPRTPSSLIALSQGIPEKAKVILDWFCQTDKPMKRLAAVIDLCESDNNLLYFRFLKLSNALGGESVATP